MTIAHDYSVASHNYNTPTAGRRGATLSATYLGGHLTFTSNHRHADRQTDRQDRQTRQTDRQNSNMTWIAIGRRSEKSEGKIKDSHLRYHSGADSGQAVVNVLANYSIIDFLLIFPGMTFRVHLGGGKCFPALKKK